mgnify:CR=1 FL=1
MLSLASPLTIDRVGEYVADGVATQPDRTVTNLIVIHHAAASYGPGKAVNAIWQYHAARWPDYGRIGYHEVIQIEHDGVTLRAHQVNAPDMVGAGVYGRNHECYHICAATNFSGIPDDAWIEALAQRAADAQRRYPRAALVGHREITIPGHSTSCPGTRWSAWRPTLVARVTELLTPPPARFVVRGLPIYQRQDMTGLLAGHLATGEEVHVDRRYPNGAGHLVDGRGFVIGACILGNNQ